MNDDITYIGTFEDLEKSNVEPKKQEKVEKFKVNKHNPKLEKMLSSTKNNSFSKNIFKIVIIILLIYILRPISLLKNYIYSKSDYYSQIESLSIEGIDTVGYTSYFTGKEYYKECANTLNYPVDGYICMVYELYHRGMDLVCEKPNGNVYASADGTVVKVGVDSKYGNEVLIKHSINGKTLYTYYANLSEVYVNEGQYVTQNYVIGLEGGNPNIDAHLMESEGHHIHFEVRRDEAGIQNLNPAAFIY